MSFPERIKSLRMQKRYSQSELSKLIGVKSNTIWRWENNKAKPDTETIIKIARALNTTASYLLGETDSSTLDIIDTAQKLANDDIDLKEPITAGISGNMITIQDWNTKKTISIPNNEEGRKTLALLINSAMGSETYTVASTINGDNNNDNNLGIIQN